MVEFINFNNKKYPIRIQYYALVKFKAETGKSFDSLQKAALKAQKDGSDLDLSGLDLDEFSMMEPLLYYSLISGLKAVDKKAKLDLERDDMFDVLEECYMEFVGTFSKFFADEKGAEDIGKKSMTIRQKKRIETKKKKSTIPKTSQ